MSWEVELAINPVGWSNDDLPELGGDIPLSTCLDEAREAGYAGVELGWKFPREAEVLRPLLELHGLRLASGWHGARLLERGVDAEIEAMGPHLALLRAMGCRALVFAEVSGSIQGDRARPLSTRPVLGPLEWAELAAGLDRLAAEAGRQGLRLCYHHHLGTVVETPDEIDRLMATTGPDVALLLDTGHLDTAGCAADAVIARHGARLGHVHCKDVRPADSAPARAADSSFLDAVLDGIFTVPGDGHLDFAAILGRLRGAGYAGWLVVEAEQDPAVAPPARFARLGWRTLDDAIARTGE